MQTFHTSKIHSEILDRIDGCEDNEDSHIKIYNTARIKRIIHDPEDDTNENTRFLLEQFFSKIKTERFAIIHQN
jgi:hypothetical protein